MPPLPPPPPPPPVPYGTTRRFVTPQSPLHPPPPPPPRTRVVAPPPRTRVVAPPRSCFPTRLEATSLIDLRRSHHTEIMLMKLRMLLPNIMAAVLAMDDTVLDIDQIQTLIKCCPNKEEMELLKNYTGDKTTLGKSEQYYLERMKVPRVDTKLKVFSFKILFSTQITELKESLNVVNSAYEEVRTSQKLKEIMKTILYLGNTLNQGTARGYAVGFRLDSLLKLSDLRAANRKTTLMHYLCKVLASKASDLLDFHKDLGSLESASKIELKSLAEDMQALNKGLENLNKELTASESDGPASDVFRNKLKDFIPIAETEVATILSLYAVVGNNADQLAHYFGEDPKRCPFEQVTATLLSFIRLFKKAHQENIKQAELEKKKAAQPPLSHGFPPFDKISPPPPMVAQPPPPSFTSGGSPPPPPPPSPFGSGGPPPPPPPPFCSGGPPPPPPPPFIPQHDLPHLKPFHWFKITRTLEGSLWDELQRAGDTQTAPELDISEIEALFYASVQKPLEPHR